MSPNEISRAPSAEKPSALASDLATLCRSCGMCCDGSLFGRVDLEPEEEEPARRNRLPVLPSGKAFEQPCSALAVTGEHPHATRDCSIYEQRPKACRRFTCRLYERHGQQGGPLAPRLGIVRRVRELGRSLEEAGFEPADFLGARAELLSKGPSALRAAEEYDELSRLVEESFARAGPSGVA